NASSNKTVIVWNVESGEEIRSLSYKDGWLWPAVFSPDGKYLLSRRTKVGCGFGLVEIATGKELQLFEGHPSHDVFALSFTPDGQYILSAANWGGIRFWETATGKLVWRLDEDAIVAQLSRDGKTVFAIVVGEGETRLKVWETKGAKLLRQIN